MGHYDYDETCSDCGAEYLVTAAGPSGCPCCAEHSKQRALEMEWGPWENAAVTALEQGDYYAFVNLMAYLSKLEMPKSVNPALNLNL